MGGCRCKFRDCNVTTNQTHYFSFPHKCQERLEKWCAYAQVPEVLSYPIDKQKNVKICARHFRDEHFMNYKKNKLTATAVPTVWRLSEDKMLDFEKNLEAGVLVDVPKPSKTHLIPPAGFECPLFLERDEFLLVKLKQAEEQIECFDISSNTEENSNINITTQCLLSENEIEFIDMSNEPNNVVKILETIQVSPPLTKRSKLETPRNQMQAQAKILNNLKTYKDMVILDVEQKSESSGESQGCDFILKDFCDIEDGEDFEVCESYKSENNDETYEVHIEDVEAMEEIQSLRNSLVLSEENCNGLRQQLKDVTAEMNARLSATRNELKQIKNDLILEKKRNEKLLQDLPELITTYHQENTKLKEMHMIGKETGVSNENEKLKKQLTNLQNLYQKQSELHKNQQNEQSKKEELLRKQIICLEQDLKSSQDELSKVAGELNTTRNNYTKLQIEKIHLVKQQKDSQDKLQCLQKSNDIFTKTNTELQSKFDCLKQTYSNLQLKYSNLEKSTSHTPNTNVSESKVGSSAIACIPSNTLSKAQLFNGIKRYLSSAMVSLLRMEMFGSSERDFKPDERQVAMDILGLGETVYRYFTDEWRFRLPALKDVRKWLSESHLIDDEEDL